jgi:fatty-acyl-CoA synthase
MDGLMMSYPLTLSALLDHAAELFPQREIVSRLPDRSVHRTTYGVLRTRVRRLAAALVRMGLRPGDRVATLAWNHARHLEAYFAVPLAGGVLHTLNPRLFPADLAYIVNHAGDRFLLVDDVLFPVWERFRAECHVPDAVVWTHGAPPPAGTIDYEALVESAPAELALPRVEENQAAALCYTSGTTGKPKGVLYSHRALVLHSLVSTMPDAINLSQRDAVLAVVPMFHANAWGLPFTCTMLGAKQVLPGPHLDAASLLHLFESERVTFAAGVPTIWFGILEALDKEPHRWNLSALREMVVGGSAVPRSMIEAFEKRYGINVIQAWGMTETSPLGSACRLKRELESLPEDERFRIRATQGLPVPFVETRVVSHNGVVPADGKTMGELQVRGPWVASGYYEAPPDPDKFTQDGWLRTGDVVTVDGEGYLRITDRSKDLIKSGGEWISSVDLENALMGHASVREAAVVAVKDPKWGERPVACVVLKDGALATEGDLREHLRPRFPGFHLPDSFLFLPQLPRTATGKFLKSALREQVARALGASPAPAVARQ